MTQMLAVNGVDAGYGPAQVLKSVSLRLDEGELVTVLGANGAGKTTLMHTIVGLVKATAGEIVFSGRGLLGMRPERIVKRGLALVPEGRRTFATLTVMENLVMGAYSRSDRQAVANEIEELFSRFPRLSERKAQRAGTLSGGEQQQLVICRALLSKPRLILLDEPSLGLAPVMMDTVFELVTDLRQRDGLTVLIVEQNVRRALAIADRAYVLDNGSITSEGSGKDMLAAAHKIEESYLGKTSQ